MSSKSIPWRRRRIPISFFVIPIIVFTTLALLLMFTLRPIDSSIISNSNLHISEELEEILSKETVNVTKSAQFGKKCATVEEMGQIFTKGGYVDESLRVRRIIRHHFTLNGAARVRELPPDEFCKHGFVIGKASEAGFGNEMYKILTAAGLSVMLNRSLIIGQTRDKYPFGDYITYSNFTFTLKEVKHLWRQNRCLAKYGRHLFIRSDDFLKPARTDILCSNWREWQEPILWLQNTTDAVAAQFFLKNVHPEMREAASNLFGKPEDLQYMANVFGELMSILVSPSKNVESAVNWALKDGTDPDIALHMRMMMNRSVRAVQAALDCIKNALHNLPIQKPKVVLVSDTPHFIKDIAPHLEEFAEVVHFDYEHFKGNISGNLNSLNFRVKDWGPAPRWVAFVDFFLASRTKHAVVTGAHRRVGTTYAQLIAALSAAYRLEETVSSNSSITFLSSFQRNLVSDGLRNQVGWGHVWNRFAGPLSCHGQSSQCALTPLLPPGWWDGLWQSPIHRDVQRLELYGVKLSGFGTFDEEHLNHFCRSRKTKVVGVQLI